MSIIRLNRRCFILLLLILAILSYPGISFARQKATVEVKGVSCPFCAFGLEKKLRQLPGVEKVVIKISEGRAEIEVTEGRKITKEEVEQAVKDSGFSPGKIEMSEDKEMVR